MASEADDVVIDAGDPALPALLAMEAGPKIRIIDPSPLPMLIGDDVMRRAAVYSLRGGAGDPALRVSEADGSSRRIDLAASAVRDDFEHRRALLFTAATAAALGIDDARLAAHLPQILAH